MNARKIHRVDDHRVPQRGWAATAGILLIALGVWGALVPFIGPYFDFAFLPDDTWSWTAPRGWLSVLPGAVTALAGLILLGSAKRGGAALGAWAAVLGGAWFVIGPVLAAPLRIGQPGTPTGDSTWMRALEQLAYHELLGVVVVMVAAITLGRHGGTRTLITQEQVATEPVSTHTERRDHRRRDPAVVVDDAADRQTHRYGEEPGRDRTAQADVRRVTAETDAQPAAAPDRRLDDPVLGPVTREQAQERLRQADGVQGR